MYTNPIIIHIKYNRDFYLPEIIDGYLKKINKISTNNNQIFFDFDYQVDNNFRIMELIKHYDYCITPKSTHLIGLIYIKYIDDGFEIYFFRYSNLSGNSSVTFLRLIKFFLDDFELIEPITTSEYTFLAWLNPEKILNYETKSKKLPKDLEKIEKFNIDVMDLQLREPKEFPPKYWLEIDDNNWDRKLLELWWGLNSCKEIAKEIGRTEKRVINRLSQLRKKYLEIKVPKENDLRKLYKSYIDSLYYDIY